VKLLIDLQDWCRGLERLWRNDTLWRAPLLGGPWKSGQSMAGWLYVVLVTQAGESCRNCEVSVLSRGGTGDAHPRRTV
jgi:hypothetical protein